MASASRSSDWWLECRYCNEGAPSIMQINSGRQGHLIGQLARSKETHRSSTGWGGLKTHLDEGQ